MTCEWALINPPFPPVCHSVILLVTLNARFAHASLGLRCLYANMGDLQSQTKILEYIITLRPSDVAEKLLAENPSIIGFGVYIWNVRETEQIIGILKQVAPHIKIVLGGPEVSHETASQTIAAIADHIITGQGDWAFAEVCRSLLQGRNPPKTLAADPPPLHRLQPPYPYYTAEDIAHRTLYVEASRGCPFKCQFCLSSLDKTAWAFELDGFLQQMQGLYERGARQFKFVDRTFNLNIHSSLRILQFFLERLSEGLFLHFEVVPDRLPAPLQAALAQFPPGVLQLEVGVQSFNPDVQALIDRKQDNAATESNLRWLRENTHAHLHTDLIAGLPGEDLASFGLGFDRLISLNPHEIQVGILKRLRGAPIARHAQAYRLRFNPQPPYTVLQTDRLDFQTLQRLGRFARYWDIVGNSGRFHLGRELVLGDEPFARFLRFSDWVFGKTGRTHEIAQDLWLDLVYDWLTLAGGVAASRAKRLLAEDFQRGSSRSIPKFLRDDPAMMKALGANHGKPAHIRQARHLHKASLPHDA